MEFDGVDVVAELGAELDCREQRGGPLVEGLIHDPVDAGRRHQRRRARERRDARVRAVLEQQAHDGDVARERRAQERRLAREVDPRQRAQARDEAPLRRILARARVGIGAALEQQFDEVQRGRAVDAVVALGAVDVEIADVDGGPKRRLAIPVRGVDVGAALDEVARDGEMLACPRARRAPPAMLAFKIAFKSGVTPSASARSSSAPASTSSRVTARSPRRVA